MLQFRHIFLQAYLKERKESKAEPQMSEDELFPEDDPEIESLSVDEKKVLNMLTTASFQIAKKFFEAANLNKYLPSHSIDSINEFLNKLVFAVDQPNEIELDAIIKDEIINYFSDITYYIDVVSIANKFEVFMLNWTKQTKATYLTHDDIANQFASWAQTCLAFHREASVVENRFEFIEDLNVIQKVKKILNSDSKARILTAYHQCQLLTEMKLLQAISDLGIVLNERIFLDLKDSSQQINSAICPVKAFKAQTNNLALMVVENFMELGQHAKELNIFLEIVANQLKKRLILIFPKGHEYALETFLNGMMAPIATLDKNEIYDAVIDNDNNLIHLKQESLKKMKFFDEARVTFLGNELSLGSLLDDKAWSFINGDVLRKLFFKDKIKIGKPPTDISYDEIKTNYILRSLRRRIVISENIRQSKDHYIINQAEEMSESRLGNRELVLISESIREFDALCDLRKNITLHWFEQRNCDLMWKKTRGSVNKLRRFIHNENDLVKRDDVIEVNEVRDLPDSVVIISAQPGMGKSTLLTHLATPRRSNNELCNLWILKINLEDYSKDFDCWKNKNITKKDVIKFLLKTVKFESLKNEHLNYKQIDALFLFNENTLTIKLDNELTISASTLLELQFFAHYYNEGKVILLLDGFDEIIPYYTSQVLDLIEVLKLTKVEKLFVTTRPYNNIQSELEDRLGTFSYDLMQLSTDGKKELLVGIWKKINNDNSCSQFFTNLDEIFSNIIKLDFDGKFLGIPLHLIMICTVYLKRIQNTETLEKDLAIFENLTIYTLYKAFFLIKFDEILCGQLKSKFKINYDTDRENALIKNGKLALIELVDDKSLLDEIISEQDRHLLIEEVKQAKEKTGLVDRIVNDKPRFVHRTYAEYCAAELLAYMLNNPQREQAKRLLYTILTKFTDQSRVIFMFFNYKILSESDNSFILISALDGSLSENYQNIDEIYDSYGRTPIHLSYYCGRWNSMQKLAQKYPKAMGIKDKLFEWTPFHYYMVNHISCSYYANFYSRMDMIEIDCNVKDIYGKTPLILSALRNCPDTCFRYCSEIAKSKKDIDVNVKDCDGQSALDYAIEMYNSPDKSGSLFQYLLDKGSHICGKGKKTTPLQVAFKKQAWWLFARIFEKILNDHGEEYGKENIRGMIFNNCFIVRLLSENVTVARFLLNTLSINVNIQDLNGKTALHFACKNFYNEEITDLLLKNGAHGHISDNNGKTAIKSVIQDRIYHMHSQLSPEEYFLFEYLDRSLHNNAEYVNGLLLEMRTLEDPNLIVQILSMFIHLGKYLIKNTKIDVNKTNYFGKTALHYTIQLACYLKFDLFIDHEDDFYEFELHGFHDYENINCIDSINFLLSQGADPNLKDDRGKTPIDYMLPFENEPDEDSFIELLSILFSQKEEFIKLNDNNIVRLMSLSERITSFLLIKTSVHINMHDSDGKTALHLAAMWGNRKLIACLLKNNADINIRDNDGHTAFHYLPNDFKFEELVCNHNYDQD